MGKRRPWAALLLICLISLLAPAPASAAVQVRLDNALMSFDVPPLAESGRILVPMRAIFEALGARVDWNGDRQEIRATTRGGTEVYLWLGGKVALVNRQVALLDVTPRVVDQRTLVPIRFVSEALGAKVEWDGAAQTVRITSPAPGSQPAPVFAKPPASAEELLQQALPATVLIDMEKIRGGRAVGSGFFLNDEGLVATNYHVLEGAAYARVITRDGKIHSILEVVAADEERDIMWLRTGAVGYPTLPLSPNETLSPGQAVLAIGHPLGLDWSVTEGIISSAERMLEKQPWIQHSAPISPGNSGGPLISRSTGAVVGMNTWVVAATGVQNVNFAAPVRSILAAKLVGVAASDVPSPAQPPPTPPEPEPLPEPKTIPVSAPGQWASQRGDVLNRAAVSKGPGTHLQLLWPKPANLSGAKLALYEGVLYAAEGHSGGDLSALDPETGAVRWERSLDSHLLGPSVGPHGVYVGVSMKAVWAIKPDGTDLWSSDIPAILPPTVTSDGVFVADKDGAVHKLDPKTGERLWSVPLGRLLFPNQAAPAVYEDKLFLGASDKLFALDTGSGRLLYTINQGSYVPPVIDNGFLYLGTDDGVHAFDPATGRQIWGDMAAVSGVRWPLAAAQGTVVFSADGGFLYGLDAITGKTKWRQYLGTSSSYGSPVIAGDIVYVGAYMGGIRMFKLQSGEPVGELMPNAEVRGTVLATETRLYVPTNGWGTYGLKRP